MERKRKAKKQSANKEKQQFNVGPSVLEREEGNKKRRNRRKKGVRNEKRNEGKEEGKKEGDPDNVINNSLK